MVDGRLGLKSNSDRPTYIPNVFNIFFFSLKVVSKQTLSLLLIFLSRLVYLIISNSYVQRLEKVNIRTVRGAGKVLGTILCIGGSLIFIFWKGPYVSKAIFKEPLIDINQDSGNSSGKNWIKGSAFILTSDIAWSAWLILQVYVHHSNFKH